MDQEPEHEAAADVKQEKWPKRYRTVRALAQAIAAGEVPSDVVSPGTVAAAFGVTRQAIYQRIKRGTLRAWVSEDVILIDWRMVKRELRERRGIAPTQRELLAYDTNEAAT